MAKTAPPGKTRFAISIRPRDGSAWVHLACDIDEVLIPREGDAVGIDTDYGVTAEVCSVGVYPTCDPMVYVTCRGVVVADAAEAREIAEVARRHGWRVS